MRDFKVGDLVDVNAGEKWAGTVISVDPDGAEVVQCDLDGEVVKGGIFSNEKLILISRGEPRDTINHPEHYAGSNGIECIDAMRATLTPDEFRGYCKGAALKYIWRERMKGGNESLAKAVWYLNEAQK